MPQNFSDETTMTQTTVEEKQDSTLVLTSNIIANKLAGDEAKRSRKDSDSSESSTSSTNTPKQKQLNYELATSIKFKGAGEHPYHLNIPEKGKCPLSNLKCIVLISVGKKIFEGNALKLILQLAKENFHDCTIVAAGTLQRYNIAAKNNIMLDPAHREAFKLEEQWKKRNGPTCDKYISNPIYGWDYWTSLNNFIPTKKLIEDTLLKDENYKSAMQISVQEYVDRQCDDEDKSLSQKIKNSLAEYSKQYLIEECAATVLMAEAGYHAIVYPTKATAIVQKTREKFIEPKHPGCLPWIRMKFGFKKLKINLSKEEKRCTTPNQDFSALFDYIPVQSPELQIPLTINDEIKISIENLSNIAASQVFQLFCEEIEKIRVNTEKYIQPIESITDKKIVLKQFIEMGDKTLSLDGQKLLQTFVVMNFLASESQSSLKAFINDKIPNGMQTAFSKIIASNAFSDFHIGLQNLQKTIRQRIQALEELSPEEKKSAKQILLDKAKQLAGKHLEKVQQQTFGVFLKMNLLSAEADKPLRRILSTPTTPDASSNEIAIHTFFGTPTSITENESTKQLRQKSPAPSN